MDKYKDIINLPHHVSANRRPMSMYDRAAQFAPFAALTGHDDAIAETARQTDTRIELSDDRRCQLDEMLAAAISRQKAVIVTYFVADGRKKGGAYVARQGVPVKIDEYDRLLIFSDKTSVPLDDVFSLSFAED